MRELSGMVYMIKRRDPRTELISTSNLCYFAALFLAVLLSHPGGEMAWPISMKFSRQDDPRL